MPAILWVLAGLAVAGSVLLVLLVLRVRSIGRRVGSFECGLRRGAGWAGGIGAFGADRLDWYRVLSGSFLPERSWRRARIEVLARTVRTIGERPTSIMEVLCRCDGEEFTLAMSRAAASGLISWLEAAPPGGRVTMR